MSDLRYGKRNVAKMIRQVEALRQLIRAEGTPDIQTAWDAVEEHIDFAYRTLHAVHRAHVNETPKSEHEKGDMLTPEPWNPATSPSMTDLMVDPDQMREDREERAMLAREDDQ